MDFEDFDAAKVVKILDGYKTEAREARNSGMNPRDQIWEANWNRYWARYDNSKKAPWQSRHVMPEAAQYVDRWAAAMREALDAGGDTFWTIEDAGRQFSDLEPHISKLLRYVLAETTKTADGHYVDFSSVFEDEMKLGSLMMLSGVVYFADGHVRVDPVDPREVWYDPTGRNLYRWRRYKKDKYQLLAEVNANPELYDSAAVADLQQGMTDSEQVVNRATSTGMGTTASKANRTQIDLDEWYCTVIDDTGEVLYENVLVVVANDKYVIRGPEKNPFWHGEDWITSCPMVSIPLSVYGRTYMEDWGAVADAFVDLTQILLDGVFTSALKAFAAKPAVLDDPAQISEGLAPNTIFQLSEDYQGDPAHFMREIDLGALPAGAVQIWQALKQEMQEGAKLNEISLGQSAPNARTTATEITETQRSGSAMIRSMARTIETRWLEPVLNQIWKVALQHLDFKALGNVLGQDTAMMLDARREEFAQHKLGFRVRALSGMIDKQARLKGLMTFLQTAAQNDALMQATMGQVDMATLVQTLMRLFGVDPDDLQPTAKEKMLRQLQPSPQTIPGAAPPVSPTTAPNGRPATPTGGMQGA